MKIREWVLIVFFILFSITQTGCASFNKKLKSWLGGKSPSNVADEQKPPSTLTKFSEAGDVAPRVRRQYKRTTKESLADESALDPKSGSLWVMEGQGAYLFSQNVVRLVGDPLAVSLEGDPKDQLQSKVNVIRQLLAKIDERQKARLRNPASEDSSDDSDKDKTAKDEKPGKDKKDKGAANSGNNAQNGAQPEPSQDLGVKVVPTRIVERTLEGNYRVKGLQPVMIGTREYKIIVTGIVRAEDFNEEGIPASKLLDPKFDIVSARHKETEL